MNGFECMLIKYPQRTQGQETVKTLQEKIIVEQSGLRLEMASTKHFHIIQMRMVTHSYKQRKMGF